MKIESFSFPGIEKINEDRIRVSQLGNVCIGVVCDGMGGLERGDLAAEIVSEAIVEYIIQNLNISSEETILKAALEYADNKLGIFSRENNCKMGTAVAVGFIEGDKMIYSWQGNVRIYHERDGVVNCLTEDHKAYLGYGRYALTRCIKGRGIREDVPISSKLLLTGDKILFCTDGLYSLGQKYLQGWIKGTIQAAPENADDDASILIIKV